MKQPKADKAKAKNITFTKAISDRGKAIMDARGIDGWSELIQILVREEWERRHPPTISSPLAVEAAKIAQGAGHGASVISHEGVSTKPRKGLPLRGTSKRTSRGSTH